MRWVLVCLGSLATGSLAILLSLILGLLWLVVRSRHIGLGVNAWNPVSAFAGHWELGVFSLTVLIFRSG